MNAIPANSAAHPASLPVAPAPAAPAPAAEQPAASGDALAAMRPAMDAAFAVGRPTDASGAAAILGTGASYLHGASATLARLDEGIGRRNREIEQLRISDPGAAQDKQGQLDMLQRLRDRIQLSIERVSDILAGRDRDDVGGPHPRDPNARRLEHLELLEERRRLLAPAAAAAVTAAGAENVAGAYSSGVDAR